MQIKTTTSNSPLKKSFYAWTSIRAGDSLLLIEVLKDYYKFLYFPGNSFFYLTVEDFNKYLTSGVLEFVELMPEEIFEETLKYSLSCNAKI